MERKPADANSAASSIVPSFIVNQIHSVKAELLNRKGIHYWDRFEHTDDLHFLDKSIATFERAVEVTPNGHAHLPSRLINLSSTYALRFDRSGDPSDNDQALKWNRKAIELTPPDSKVLSGYLNNLGISLASRFGHTGRLTDLNEAIIAYQRSINTLSPNDPDLPQTLSNLGTSFNKRFVVTGNVDDITQAIEIQRRSLELTAVGDIDIPGLLQNLGTSLQIRYKRMGNLQDITEAIDMHKKAVNLIPPSHSDFASQLHSLGNALQHHFEFTGDLPSISEAIQIKQKAVDNTPLRDAELPARLSDLGSAFLRRYDKTASFSDIEDALKFGERAVELAPNRPSSLNSLGNALQSRFRHTGELIYITKAIKLQQTAVDLTSSEHPSLPGWLVNLGNAYQARFEHSGDLKDMDEAIRYRKRAVELTPQGHPELPSFLNNLGAALSRRFESTGELTDIDEAISAQRKAVEMSPPGHAEVPMRLSNLGNSLQRRFRITRALMDIVEAITTLQQAVDLSPPDYAELPSLLNNLGTAYQRRFQYGHMPDINEAIRYQLLAVELCQVGHASLPGRYKNLANSFKFRLERTKSQQDVDNSIKYYKISATISGPPSVRLEAASNWATLSSQHYPTSHDTLDAYDTAIRLISLVAGLEQTIHNRQLKLRDISGLTLKAAAAACALGRPDRALEWLEQGRCLVWSQLNQLRPPLDELRLHDKDLAERIAVTSRALESAGSRSAERPDPSKGKSAEDEALTHVQLANEWEDLLTTVRSIPGFENFLQPQPFSSLSAHLPDSGYVVVINVHEDRCDAIALASKLDSPIHIPLSHLTLARGDEFRRNLTSHLNTVGMRARGSAAPDVDEDQKRKPVRRPYAPGGRGVIAEILAGMWNDIVKPIFEGLGFMKPKSTELPELPRIWWCATGPLAFLPLHAAGLHGSGELSTALDYVISSYTPTVSALTGRVKDTHPIQDGAAGIFLVSQPDTPGLGRIPGTSREVHSIEEQAIDHGIRVLLLEGDEATTTLGLENMEKYSSVHFACHAIQDDEEPMHSGFFFHDGRIDLSTVIKRNLHNADLAFLSACQTSTGEEKLAEEAVHLAAGMLAAGYRGVVATMWSIGDRDAPDVARDFYSFLFSGSNVTKLNSTQAARALHLAIQMLRNRLDQSERSFLAWVPYVHFGM
ncbi:hypothetical protein FA15DRAFT_249782 [Coprinopsis marcescibilis]|uniref:CHAT domain-containing protein n=1 Tax=Coprinopsis marcescibilis TaxID=230819 RepID=A0A5C3KFQ1_COPMA|nr:hypothetical protein FA15DRAFT_249782 [Coprinopsis marcescibilis]